MAASRPGLRLNFLEKLCSPLLRREFQSYLAGNLPGPVIIEFDPTTACNYACPECISAPLLNKSQIPGPRIESLLREFVAAGARAIIFIGGGEPLAHKCMPQPIILAHQLGLAIGITTNGSLLGRHLNAIAQCVAWTRVSMDAASEETYRLLRPTSIREPFQQVLQQMKALARVKRGSLGYSFLVIQRPIASLQPAVSATPRPYITNAGEMHEAARIAKDHGCDYIEYKPMVDDHHHLVVFDEDVRSVVREQYHRALQLGDSSFEILATDSFQILLEQRQPDQPKAYNTCPSMELRTTVTPSGIYPCPYHRGREDKRLGTIDAAPFDSFWQSQSRLTAMQLLDPSRDCPFYCCRHELNQALLQMKTGHSTNGLVVNDAIGDDNLDDPFF